MIKIDPAMKWYVRVRSVSHVERDGPHKRVIKTGISEGDHYRNNKVPTDCIKSLLPLSEEKKESTW